MKKSLFRRVLSISLLLGVFAFGKGIAGEIDVTEKGERTDTISVPEMQCGMCEMRIERRLKKISGVLSVSADAESDVVVVTYNQKKTSRNEIEQAIANIGYNAGEKETTSEAQAKLSPCCKPGAHE